MNYSDSIVNIVVITLSNTFMWNPPWIGHGCWLLPRLALSKTNHLSNTMLTSEHRSWSIDRLRLAELIWKTSGDKKTKRRQVYCRIRPSSAVSSWVTKYLSVLTTATHTRVLDPDSESVEVVRMVLPLKSIRIKDSWNSSLIRPCHSLLQPRLPSSSLLLSSDGNWQGRFRRGRRARHNKTTNWNLDFIGVVWRQPTTQRSSSIFESVVEFPLRAESG